jgi:hypothetical protein
MRSFCSRFLKSDYCRLERYHLGIITVLKYCQLDPLPVQLYFDHSAKSRSKRSLLYLKSFKINSRKPEENGAFRHIRCFQIMFAGHLRKFVRIDTSFHDTIVQITWTLFNAAQGWLRIQNLFLGWRVVSFKKRPMPPDPKVNIAILNLNRDRNLLSTA